MPRITPRLTVFDLAGTTMRDDGTVASVFHDVLAAEGLGCTPEEIVSVRGASKREAFLRLAGEPVLADGLLHSFVASLRQRYASAPPREVPGASTVFAWLGGHGGKLALNTGFDSETAGTLVAALGWDRQTFDAIVCGDEVPEGRPSPAMIEEAMRRTGVSDPSYVMVVGDTVLDLQAGAAARAGWIVGVTSGAHDHARLVQAPHTHIIASVADIPGLLR